MTRRACLADWLVENPEEARAIRAMASRREMVDGPEDEETRRALLAPLQVLHLLLPVAAVFEVEADLWAELIQTEAPIGPLPRLPYRALMLLLPNGAGPVVATDRGAPAPHDDVLLVEDDTDGWGLAFTAGAGVTATVSPMYEVTAGGDELRAAVIRGVVNLVALLVDRQLVTTLRPAGPALGPRKAKLLARRGLTRRASTLLSLTSPSSVRAALDVDGAPAWQVRPHVRRGHWRRQHVLDAGERQVLERVERDGRPPLLVVRQWVRPCVVGKGEPQRRDYRVIL